MNRKQFILGVLSAAATGMIVTKEDVALAEEVRNTSFSGKVWRYEPEGDYTIFYEDGFINKVIFWPKKGMTSSRIVLDGWDGLTAVFFAETRDFASGSLLHRSTINIGLGKRTEDEVLTFAQGEQAGRIVGSDEHVRISFNRRTEDFVKWYAAALNPNFRK